MENMITRVQPSNGNRQKWLDVYVWVYHTVIKHSIFTPCVTAVFPVDILLNHIANVTCGTAVAFLSYAPNDAIDSESTDTHWLPLEARRWCIKNIGWCRTMVGPCLIWRRYPMDHAEIFMHGTIYLSCEYAYIKIANCKYSTTTKSEKPTGSLSVWNLQVASSDWIPWNSIPNSTTLFGLQLGVVYSSSAIATNIVEPRMGSQIVPKRNLSRI